MSSVITLREVKWINPLRIVPVAVILIIQVLEIVVDSRLPLWTCEKWIT